MNGPAQSHWRARFFLAGIAGILAIGAVCALPAPAQARVWISGGPCCGYWGPGPYYGGYYPPPYYYAPPAYVYYPPAPAGYPPPAAYPPAAAPDPSAYAPPQVPGAPAPTAYAPPAAAGMPAITYTSKPAFTNASGQTCREYKANGAGGQQVYGTACQQADGQWRVAN
jgi:hypothetical protein